MASCRALCYTGATSKERVTNMKPLRMHHVGVVLPTVEQAEHLIELFGLEVDYRGYVKSYHADLIFTKYWPRESPIEFIIPHE